MKKNTNDSDSTLFDYLDGHLSGEKKQLFEQAMENSPALQQRVHEQRLVENTLKAIHLAEPSSIFSQNVMYKINQAPQGFSLSIKSGFFLLAGTIVVSFIATILVQSGMFDSTGALITPKELGVLSKYIKAPLPSIPVNGKVIVNGIILLNLALGFVILDRAILRPYFERRMRHS
jgi:hypothetical protein